MHDIVRAVKDHQPLNNGLRFRAGEPIVVISRPIDGSWEGFAGKSRGSFNPSFVKPDQYEEFWSSKRCPDGRLYHYNKLTNEVLWAEWESEDINSPLMANVNNSKLLDSKSIPESDKSPLALAHMAIILVLKDLQKATDRVAILENESSSVNALQKRHALKIVNRNHQIAKMTLLTFATTTSHAVHKMLLLASSTSPSHNFDSIHGPKGTILSSLTRLMEYVKMVGNVSIWNPPDATLKLYDSIRHLGIAVVKSYIALSNYSLSSTTPSKIKLQIKVKDFSSDNDSYQRRDSNHYPSYYCNDDDNENGSLNNNNLFLESVSKLDNIYFEIENSIEAVVKEIVLKHTPRPPSPSWDHSNSHVKSDYQSVLAKLVKDAVGFVGKLITLLNHVIGYPFYNDKSYTASVLSSDWVNQGLQLKTAIYDSVQTLVNALGDFFNSDTITLSDSIIEKLHCLRKDVRNMVVFGKLSFIGIYTDEENISDIPKRLHSPPIHAIIQDYSNLNSSSSSDSPQLSGSPSDSKKAFSAPNSSIPLPRIAENDDDADTCSISSIGSAPSPPVGLTPKLLPSQSLSSFNHIPPVPELSPNVLTSQFDKSGYSAFNSSVSPPAELDLATTRVSSPTSNPELSVSAPEITTLFNNFKIDESSLNIVSSTMTLGLPKSNPERRATILGSGSNPTSPIELANRSVEKLEAVRKSKENEKWYLSRDCNPSDILFDNDGLLKGGTLEALVEMLTYHDAFESHMTRSFLLTFRSFTSPLTFLQILFKRFQLQPPTGLIRADLDIWHDKKFKPIRLRVFNVLKSWMDNFFCAETDTIAIDPLEQFALTIMKDAMPSASDQLMKLVLKRKNGIVDQRPSPSPSPSASPLSPYTPASATSFKRRFSRSTKDTLTPPILPKNWKKIKLTDLDPLEVARQLTLIESRLYQKIEPWECLQKAWSDKVNTRAPNIQAMIHTTNDVTGWVSDTILREPNTKLRASIMKHFILIAEKCFIINNFNLLMAILAALSSSPIHRLKRTRDLLSTRTSGILESLKEVMSPSNNFAAYRNQLRSINPPCVPFLGRYLTDLTMIEDGNPDFIKSSPHLINFDKRIKLADKIREIQQYQDTFYSFKEVNEIQAVLKRKLVEGEKDAESLYQRSLIVEPREREDEKIARLLLESGFL